MILNICNTGEVLEILRLVKILVWIVRVAVPLLLIISISTSLIHNITDGKLEGDMKKYVNKIIAAICVFFIPTFIGLILNITGNSDVYSNCFKDVSLDSISKAYYSSASNYVNKVESSLKQSDYNLAKRYINNVKDEDEKNDLLDRLSDLEVYVNLNEEISSLYSLYSKSKFEDITNKVNSLPEGEEKTILENNLLKLKEAYESGAIKNVKYVKTDIQTDSIGKYHVNGYNGLKYYLYSQCEGNWQNIKLGDNTFCEIGCGLTTCTVLITSYNPNVTPYNSRSFGDDYHHESVIEGQTNNMYDCTKYTNNDLYNPSVSKSTITSAMKNGAVLSVKAWGRSKGGNSKFTGSQHFMAIIDYSEDDDQMFVGNAYGNYTYGKYGWFNSDDVLTTLKDVVICYPR